MARQSQSRPQRQRDAATPWFTSGKNDKGPPFNPNPKGANARKVYREFERDYAAGRQGK